ncbi:MAG: ferritin [Planctomycetota bacterium]|nr:ferritin [Planctomycetota bacterium]
MISRKMEAALNEQINAELYSSYLYLSMAAYFESKSLDGMAKWMGIQADEEREHAMRIYKHLVDRGGRVTLKEIAAPPAEWKSPQAVFEAVLEHEKKVTGMIHKLADLAASEKDHAASSMLKWFIDEQVEEEATAARIVEHFRMLGDSRGGLLMLDRELGERGEK